MQHVTSTAINMEEIIFFSDLHTMFREVHKIRILVANCFETNFGTVNFMGSTGTDST
jgi:hypothetical protein